MNCPHCKKECPEGSIICPFCLKKLSRRRVWPFILIGGLLLLCAAAVIWYLSAAGLAF